MAKSVRHQNVRDIVPCLRCPNCSNSNFEVRDRETDWPLLHIGLAAEGLHCVSCREEFPVTVEGIPILWTPEIRKYLSGSRSEGALSANIDVYDETSDHYLMHVRKSEKARGRFMACVRAVEKEIRYGWHVDIGCGPGHVLIWTSEWAAEHGIKQIGVDVSIQNLRNVLSTTKAYAVLGDAAALPFRDRVANLVTEASVLHHILEWRAMIGESSRIAAEERSAIIFDNEPTKKLLNWNRLARFVFESRFTAYKLLSFVSARYMSFRNTKLAKLNYYSAEVHNQPGRGFDPADVRQAFQAAGRDCTIYFRMGSELGSGTGRNSPQENILLKISGADLANPEYGVMTMIAR